MQQVLFSFFLKEKKQVEEPITKAKKSIQRDIILKALLVGPRHCGQFLAQGIAQYNARIYELRRMGHEIIYDKKRKAFILKNQKKVNTNVNIFQNPVVSHTQSEAV